MEPSVGRRFPDCMGACEVAPMIQLDKDYYGNLTPERIEEILREQ